MANIFLLFIRQQIYKAKELTACGLTMMKPGFHMFLTVVKLSDDLSQQPKYNSLDLKIRGVIRTREYL